MTCPDCGHPWRMHFRTGRGLKCQTNISTVKNGVTFVDTCQCRKVNPKLGGVTLVNWLHTIVGVIILVNLVPLTIEDIILEYEAKPLIWWVPFELVAVCVIWCFFVLIWPWKRK